MPTGTKRAVHAGPVEELWELPEGWQWLRARDIADVVGGGTPRNASDATNFDPDGIPWITPADLSNYEGATIGRGARSLSESGFKNSAARLLPKGTVLISSRAPVGYCAVAANPIATNQGFKSLVLRPGINPHYVRYYVLRSRQYLEANASGTTFKELSGAALGELAFPVPPADVQDAIVARIDELFAEIDDGERAICEATAAAKVYRNALLNSAMRGELTADWRANNAPVSTGRDYLMTLAAERERRSAENGRKSSPPYEPAELPRHPIPETWCFATIDQLTERVTKGSSPGWQGFEYQSFGVLFVRSQNIGWGELLLDEPVFLDPRFNEVEAKAVIRSGDVLLNIVGASIGRATVADERLEGANSNQAVSGIRPVAPGTLSEFLCLWLLSHDAQLHIHGNAVDVARANFSLDQIRKMTVPLPSEDEIREILSRMGRVANGQEFADELGILATDGQTLRQSILAAAFRGDLVA